MARLLTTDEIRQLPRASVVWIVPYNVKNGYIAEPIVALKCEDGTLVDEECSIYEVDEEGCIYGDIERDITPYMDGWAWQFWNGEPTELEREEAL